MIALIQRTISSSVTIDGAVHSKTGKGFLILLGVYAEDTENEVNKLTGKISKMRIFEDDDGKMNLSPIQLLEKGGEFEVMVVSQFTLCAECKGQNRPSFIKAARPEVAIPLYEAFVESLRSDYGFKVETGEFGADMKVELINDGPVTIILDTEKL